MNEWEKKLNKKNMCRESSAAFKGMFCTKYRVFKLHIKKTLRFALQYNEICYFICKNLINKSSLNEMQWLDFNEMNLGCFCFNPLNTISSSQASSGSRWNTTASRKDRQVHNDMDKQSQMFTEQSVYKVLRSCFVCWRCSGIFFKNFHDNNLTTSHSETFLHNKSLSDIWMVYK